VTRSARRLTDRQLAVLAALERRGSPVTVPELREDFPQLKASVLVGVLDTLIRRGLADCAGDRTWTYLGAIPLERKVEWIAEGRRPVAAEDIVRFWAAPKRNGRQLR
jgi:DNA-binding IclR family transcriptional regulator